MARPRQNSDEELLHRIEAALSRRTSLKRWSLADVAAEIGVAPATLVKRFGSRHGLLVALTRRWVDSTPAELPADVPPRQAVLRWVEDSFAVPSDRRAAVANLQLLVEDLADPVLAGLVGDGWTRQIDLLARALAADPASSQGDTRQLAVLILDVLNGAQLRAAAGERTAPRQAVERLLEVLL